MLAGPSRTSRTVPRTRSRPSSSRASFAASWISSCAFLSRSSPATTALTMLRFSRHHSTAVQTPALRSVGNIVTGDDLQTQVVLASGALPALLSLLSSPKEGIRKEACWTVSNITAGSPQQIQAVIDANIIPPLINILQNSDFKTKKEACWAMSNATSGGLQEPSQIRYLVSQGCIKPLCDLLKSTDNKIIQVALDGLENILKVGEADKEAAGGVNQYALFVEEAGGMVSIHNLQHHENLEVRFGFRVSCGGARES